MNLPTGPKVFPDARSALADVVRDGIMVMCGGFGLCGVPEKLIDALMRLAIEHAGAEPNI